MARILVMIGAAVGGLALWRRKNLRNDAEKLTDAAKTATARVKSSSSRKSLLIELGEAVYADRTDSDADVTSEIDRLVIDLREIDSTTEADDSESTSDVTATELSGASQ